MQSSWKDYNLCINSLYSGLKWGPSPWQTAAKHCLLLLTLLLVSFLYCCPHCSLRAEPEQNSRAVCIFPTDCLRNAFLSFRLTQNKSGLTPQARKRAVIWVTGFRCYCFVIISHSQALTGKNIIRLHVLWSTRLFPLPRVGVKDTVMADSATHWLENISITFPTNT